jgi:hypothetical protein
VPHRVLSRSSRTRYVFVLRGGKAALCVAAVSESSSFFLGGGGGWIGGGGGELEIRGKKGASKKYNSTSWRGHRPCGLLVHHFITRFPTGSRRRLAEAMMKSVYKLSVLKTNKHCPQRAIQYKT